jgi:hypothetical protein
VSTRAPWLICVAARGAEIVGRLAYRRACGELSYVSLHGNARRRRFRYVDDYGNVGELSTSLFLEAVHSAAEENGSLPSIVAHARREMRARRSPFVVF